MTPTNELRWVKRNYRTKEVTTSYGFDVVLACDKVLQQKWAGQDNMGCYCRFEWRDVPVVEEADDPQKG